MHESPDMSDPASRPAGATMRDRHGAAPTQVPDPHPGSGASEAKPFRGRRGEKSSRPCTCPFAISRRCESVLSFLTPGAAQERKERMGGAKISRKIMCLRRLLLRQEGEELVSDPASRPIRAAARKIPPRGLLPQQKLPVAGFAGRRGPQGRLRSRQKGGGSAPTVRRLSCRRGGRTPAFPLRGRWRAKRAG